MLFKSPVWYSLLWPEMTETLGQPLKEPRRGPASGEVQGACPRELAGRTGAGNVVAPGGLPPPFPYGLGPGQVWLGYQAAQGDMWAWT